VHPERSEVIWSGGLFHPEARLLDPFLGRDPAAPSYHGQLQCQRCVDVAAPVNVLLRVEAARAAIAQIGSGITSDETMTRLGLNAAAVSRFAAVTPYVVSAWDDRAAYSLPVDRRGILARLPREMLRSRWYDPRLSGERPFGIEPGRW
jgi:hypothetical protein